MKKKKMHTDNIPFLDRLFSLAEKDLGMNKSEWGFKNALSKRLSIRPSTLQRWTKGSFPEANLLLLISSVFNVTPNYLLGADEAQPQQREEKKFFILGKLTTAILPQGYHSDVPKENFVALPILSQEIAAGPPLCIDNPHVEEWALMKKSILKGRTNIIGIHISKKNGMSMYPVLKPGDLAIIDLDDKEIADGSVYAVRTEDGCTVKSLRKADDLLLLIPRNMRGYSVETLDLKSNPDPIIGRVIIAQSYFLSTHRYPDLN
jgi:SOS-response transcriptional repressor LexA